MKKDEMSNKLKKYYVEDSIPATFLLRGMYIAKINFEEERIDNKYIVIETNMVYYGIRGDFKRTKVTCYDFIENKLINFYGHNTCEFIRADLNDKDNFYYKYKYSSLSDYKKLRVGDRVSFINPENADSIETRSNPVFKIVKKQKKEANFGCYDLVDEIGYVLRNVPSILLEKSDKNELNSPNHKFNGIPRGMKQIMNKEIEKNEKRTDRPKTPSKFKFSVDIDYSDDAPIEILFKDDNDSSYTRKALMNDVSLDEKIKISNTLKDVFKKIFYNEDKDKEEVFDLVDGETTYWRFSLSDFDHIEPRIYYNDDKLCHIDYKIGNIFKSKEDLIQNSGKENIKKIKENLEKYILEK